MSDLVMEYGPIGDDLPVGDIVFYASAREVLRLKPSGQVEYAGTPDEATRGFLDCLEAAFPFWVEAIRKRNAKPGD